MISDNKNEGIERKNRKRRKHENAIIWGCQNLRGVVDVSEEKYHVGVENDSDFSE